MEASSPVDVKLTDWVGRGRMEEGAHGLGYALHSPLPGGHIHSLTGITMKKNKHQCTKGTVQSFISLSEIHVFLSTRCG